MAGRNFLCETLLLLLTVSSCEGNLYSNVLKSVPALLNKTFQPLHGDMSEYVQLLSGLSQQLSFHQIMKTYTAANTKEPRSKCDRHLNDTLEALLSNRTDWVKQMVDAIGKPRSGLLQGNLYWIGDYDECLNVTAVVKRKNGDEDSFKGKYCRAGFQIAQRMSVGIRFGPTELPIGDLNFGICVPDSCSEKDVLNLINGALWPLMNHSIQAEEVLCQEENLPLDARAIIVIVVFSILGCFIVAGTAYDVFVVHKPINEDEQVINQDEKQPLVSEDIPSPDDQSHNIRYRSYGTRDTNEPEVNRTSIQEPGQRGIGVFGRLLLAFSLYTNGAKILSTDSPKGTIGVLNGIRFISLTWVMLGHSYGFSAAFSANVASLLYSETKSFTFMAIWNATVAVDTFFLLSGLLVGYLSMREMTRAGSVRKINWVMFYIHRFWRLTPPYMLVILLYVPLFQYWYTGPFWPKEGVEANYCSNWWKNLLYINNFFHSQDTCMAWSWYLANDMQFYIISPLLIIPLYISGLLGGVVCLLVLVTTWTVTGVVTTTNDYPMGLIGGGGDLNKIGDFFDNLYVRPYARIGPYIVGVLTGYILHKTSCKVQMSRKMTFTEASKSVNMREWVTQKISLILYVTHLWQTWSRLVNLIGWIVAAACCLSVLYGNYDYISGKRNSGKHEKALYNAIHSSVWGLGVSWVIFACATGYGGIINTFLSWRLFVPLSRLTYLAYLIHPVVMQVYYLGMRQPLYITHLEMAFLFLAHVVVSYATAFVLSLAFESPFMGIEKALHRK